VKRKPQGLSPREAEDIELMCRAREGDADAFTLLVRRHPDGLIRFLFRMSWDRERAEDGAQEVFLKRWSARGRYPPTPGFSTFVYQMARNHYIDETRRSHARPVEAAIPCDDDWSLSALRSAEALEPQHQAFERYRMWRIREAIASLPEPHRLVFVLVHLEGRKLAEVSAILDIPLGTVKSRMHTAVRMLRERLGSNED